MLCNECNKNKYTRIVIGVVERYFCEECYIKWENTKKDRPGKEATGTSGPFGRKSDI